MKIWGNVWKEWASVYRSLSTGNAGMINTLNSIGLHNNYIWDRFSKRRTLKEEAKNKFKTCQYGWEKD